MKLGIKGRLIMSFLLASLVPLISVSYYAYCKSQDALVRASMEQVTSSRRMIKTALDSYFKQLQSQITTMAHDEGIKSAMVEFKKSFYTYTKDAGWTSVDTLAAKRKLAGYYKNEFAAEYAKQNENKVVDSLSILDKLNETQISLQSAYISNNENPLGSKHKLDAASEATSYNRTHALHHPNLREVLEKFGYYDIFLIDADTGAIIYSVFKELDFATSLKNGPYSTTSLGKAYTEALKLGEGDNVYMADYQTYLPSYDAPAGFLSTPIYVDGELVGVLAIQISFDEINKITLQKTSDYPSSETFLVGGDFLMRSDTLGDKDNRNVRASFRRPEKGSIRNDHIEQALRGEEHTVLAQDYIGRDVIASFGPYTVLGNKWVLKTIVLQAESLAAVAQMRLALLIGSLLAAIGVSCVALWYARSLALKLTTLAQGLSGGAGTVATTSQIIADVSTRLSEASTEQAASLQQTVASVDEISAMVQRNADSAANSSKASDASTSAAQRGKEKVEQMLGSINDIARGNEDIMSSINKSNQEINEIVHVIQAIADKTKVINDIVFQTKLLSFNASVEAARAGEHGKGFAVVAEEVGNLASMSGKAATEITDMLDKSVHRVTQIVEGTRTMMDTLVKTSKDKVEFGTKTARECAGALDEIMRNVSSVNAMVREISTASQEQSTGIREITKAMSELDQVTQQNTASSNDASHTAKDLQLQAEQLNSYVIELVKLVNGDSTASVPTDATGPQAGGRKVVQLNSFKANKAQAPAKRVVGLEFEAPKATDGRFEDV